MPQSLDAETQDIIVKVTFAAMSLLAGFNLAAQKIVLPRLRAKSGERKWMGPRLFWACVYSFFFMGIISLLVTFPIIYWGVGKVSQSEIGVTDNADEDMTASINFCEDDFTDSSWIAEPANAASSLVSYCPLALLGLFGPPSNEWRRQTSHHKRVAVVYLVLFSIGIGSTLLHALLTASAQGGDELPMLWLVAIVSFMTLDVILSRRALTSKIPNKTGDSKLLHTLVSLSAGIATGAYCFSRDSFLIFWAMFVGYAVVATFCLNGIVFILKWNDETGFRANVMFPLVVCTMWTAIFAVACWISEMLLCHRAQELEFGPTGRFFFNRVIHAAWHCSSALLAWLLIQATMSAHGVERGWGAAKLRCAPLWCGCVPYVTFTPPVKTD